MKNKHWILGMLLISSITISCGTVENAAPLPAETNQTELQQTDASVPNIQKSIADNIALENTSDNVYTKDTASAKQISHVPIYYKEDYGSVKIGQNSTIGDKGDLIVCLAMIESYLSDIPSISPETITWEHEEYIYDNGAVDPSLYELIAYTNDYQFTKELFSPGTAMNYLHSDQAVVMVHINHPSIFSPTSAYLILTGIDTTSTDAACFIVRDPNKKNLDNHAVGFTEYQEPLYRISDITAMLSESSDMYVFY